MQSALKLQTCLEKEYPDVRIQVKKQTTQDSGQHTMLVGVQ
jgi:hypothetical protein